MRSVRPTRTAGRPGLAGCPPTSGLNAFQAGSRDDQRHTAYAGSSGEGGAQVAEYILEMRNITKRFPGVTALDNVNLKVREGEIHALCGENGAGKSTLMKVLSGVYPHGTYEGEILFEDEPVAFRDISDSEAKGIVIIHQELALSPYLSIAENIFLNNEQKGALGLIDWNT